MDKDHELFLQISTQLGSISTALQGVKEDICSLKTEVHALHKEDERQREALRTAYDKAMKYASHRQDSIKEELQAQIKRNASDIIALKSGQTETVMKWYYRIKDKVIWAFLCALLVAAFNMIGWDFLK